MACKRETQETSYKGIVLPKESNLTTEQKRSVMVEVIDTLLDSGLPNMNITIACGIAGNIKTESWGFNYTAVGDHGTSYGLCQWHETRLENLYNYCKQNNLSYTTVKGQMKYLIHELSEDKTYKKAYDFISKPEIRNNIDLVAENFCRLFEIPDDIETKCPARKQDAHQVYTEYTRIKNQQF